MSQQAAYEEMGPPCSRYMPMPNSKEISLLRPNSPTPYQVRDGHSSARWDKNSEVSRANGKNKLRGIAFFFSALAAWATFWASWAAFFFSAFLASASSRSCFWRSRSYTIRKFGLTTYYYLLPSKRAIAYGPNVELFKQPSPFVVAQYCHKKVPWVLLVSALCTGNG